MVREVLKIFTDNGLGAGDPAFLGLEITDYSFKPVRMGVSDFQAELKYGRCLDDDWTGREYVTFRGERHYIRHTPTSKKDNTDERWVHSLVFVSESAEILGNVLFYDAVYDHALTKDKPCSNSTKVTFFGDIREFCDRLNCSLKYRGIGDSILDTKTNLTTLDEPVGDGFCVQVDPYGDYDKESTWEFSFEDKYIWEVITEGFNITEIPFEKRGKRIVFGAVPSVVTHKFEYGHENELLSITHRNANAKVINRITMLGSSENIPYYYPNETEYGHISVDTTGNAALTADKVTIANMTQFLSLLSPSNRAVLNKRSAAGTGIPLSKVETAFNDGPYSAYNPGTVIEHHFEANRENFIPWNVRVTFTVAQRGPFSLSVLDGRIWYQNTSGGYNDDGGSLLQGAKFEGLKKQETIGFTSQVVKSESGLDLGILDTGTYELTFSLRIPNAYEHLKGINSFCRIDTLVVSTAEAGTDASGFFWKIGDKEYKTGRLGIKVDGGLTDAMIGESIGWAASSRMPFQDHLIPPKFRQTLGAERFYEALNDTYTDPDTNKKYTFPNPFVEGAPSEHVYRDDKIKPTLKGMKNAANLYMGVIADIAFDMDDNDSLKPDTEDGDKNDSLKYEHSYFYIKLNVFNGTYGFNLFDHASQTDPMTIQMTDGSCNGCKFKIQAVEFEDETGLRSFKNPVQTTGENGTIKAGNYEDKVSGDNFQPWQQDTSAHSIWICVQKDAETFGQILPSQRNGFVPKIGDTFNIINIDLPQSYILAAEKRLEEEGIRFMSDNNEEKFTFDINASRIFFADNPDVLAELDEYSKLRVIYNGKEYEQYVSGLTINCKDGEPLPEIGISLTDTLAVGQGFVERVAERASSLIANPYTMGGYVGGAGGGISTALADKRYLNKQKADRSPHKIASDIGFEVGEFMSGSQGGIFHIDQKTGRSYIEVDEMRVRLKAIFESIQVAMLESIGGEMGITPGGSTLISYVEETETSYRCYFKGKDDDKGAECRFVVGDMVQCKESNIMDGTASAASNRYYWRLVTAVNNSMSYFELSKTDRDMTSDDKPRAGDTVMQLGSKTNNQRQSAIIMSTTNAFAPSIILYDDIDDYSLVNKSVVEYGVDTSKNPPEPFFHCYGSFFFGPRNKKTYLQFDATTGDMVFNGKFTTNCTVGDKVLADYIKEVSPPVEQEDIEDYVNNIVGPKLEGIQNQIDGVIETWFYNGVPTLTNYPASDWNTENLKIQHLGDLYYDNNTGTAYRFSKDTDGTYYWNTITDDAITKALAAAAKAQDTADQKRRTFTAQPTPPYDKGDLWVNATYPAGNTVKDAASGKYVNDILRCNTSRATGSFAIGDWGLASSYTDDTALNNFIAGYQTTINDIKTQVDGKAETWYQPTNPAAAWTDADTKAAHKGDLWYCTADIAGTAYKKGTTWYWNGTAWEQQDIPQSVFDAIDGKSAIFVAKPTSGYKENDLWFLEADYTLSGTAYKTGTLVVAKNDMGAAWSANDWVKKDRYTDDTLAQEAKDEIAGYKYLKEAIVNGASQIIGGLFLSTHIRLGEWDKTDPANPVLTKVWAGMNGIYGSGRTIASWWGGDMVDLFKFVNGKPVKKTDAELGAQKDAVAKGLVRMDGSAYFSNGNVGFEPDGSGWLAGDNITWDATGAITFGNGIKIDLGGGNDTTLGGLNTKLTNVENSMATVLALANKLSNLFTPFLGSTQKNWGDISTDADFDNIRINAGAWTESFLSARGLNSNGGPGGGGVFYLHELLDTAISNPASGQALVYNGTNWVNQAIQTGLDETALASYLTANNYAKKTDIPSLTGYATQTWVQQQGYLTAHQTIRTLTIQKNGTAVGTFNPTGSTNATLNITDVASASTLSTHTGDTTVHITAAERTKWNKVVTDFAAITGTDSDTIINKWEEVVAFLDTYTEADTLAGLLGNKADKATSITAGTGLTGGGTLAANRTLSLAASGVTAGTYFKTTVDTYGRVTSGSNPTTLSGFGITDAYTKTEADGRYVNLTGAQTITGEKKFTSKLIVAGDWTNDNGLFLYEHKDTTVYGGYVLYGKSDKLHFGTWNNSETGVDAIEIARGSKDVTFLGKIVKSGGTSTQFLKADGSVDGTAYLPKATFDELFEKVNIGTVSAPVYAIKAKFGLYTEQFLSARGVNPNGGSGGGSAGSSYNRLDTWTGYTSAMDGYVLSAKLGHELHNRVTTLEGKDYVTLNTPQTITALKTITAGLLVSGRPYGTGDDEGIVIAKAANSYAGLTLGSPTGVRSVFYLDLNNKAFWRFNNGTTSFNVFHPEKSGTIALVSDIPSLANYVTLTTEQRITGKKTFTNICIDGQPENVNMPFFLGIDSYADGGAIKYITTSKVAAAIGVYTKSETDSKYVTTLSTSGNYLTWTKNGATNNITVPYATTASSLNPNGAVSDLNATTINRNGFYYWNSDAANKPNKGWGVLLQFSNQVAPTGGASGHWLAQLASGTDDTLFYRSRTNSYDWTAWGKILTSGNTYLSGGVITINGASITPLTSHQALDYLNIKDVRSETRLPSYFDAHKASFWFNNTGTPNGEWWSGLHVKGWTNDYTAWELCGNAAQADSSAKSLYWRSGRNDAWNGWKTILDTNNYAYVLDARYYTESEINTKLAALTFNDIKDASANYLDAGTVVRRIFLSKAKNNQGYISRAAIGLTNPASSFSPVILSVGLNDAGNSWRDFVFYPNGNFNADGSVTAASLVKSGGTASQVLNADGSVTTKHGLSTVTNLGWSGTAGQIATINTLAYWNGQYASGASNLQYCDRGRFGTMATATATDYLARSGGSMTNTNVVSNLNADLLDGYHKESFDGYKYTKIDASSLNNNTWYPVVFRVPKATQTRIRVEGGSAANASWNSRTDKQMALFLDYTVQGSDWGWISPQRIINFFQLGAGAIGSNCVAGLGQLVNNSYEYVMVRGGAVYNFYTSHWITPTLYTTTFTNNNQSIAPTTTSPSAITRNNAWISDNVASAAYLRDRTNGTATYLNYGAAGITTASWLAAWNGYELRAMSPANVLTTINALSRNGGSMANTNVVTNMNADLLDNLHSTGYVFLSDANHIANCHIAFGQAMQVQATNVWNANYLLLQDISTWANTSTETRQNAKFSGEIWTFRNGGSAETMRARVVAKVAKWGSGSKRNVTLTTDNAGFLPSIIAYNSKTWLAIRMSPSYNGYVRLMGVMYGLKASPFTCIEDVASNSITVTHTGAIGIGVSYSATKLATARTINGTSFDGTANITTASWGTARNIYIADATAAHTGAAVSVNGGGNATLKLPATITAALVGNASTASTLQTTRTLWGQNFNGGGNVSGNISGCPRIYNAASSNMYLGNSDNSGWVLTQDICSHAAAGDTYWSLRANGTLHCKTALVGTSTSTYALNCASFICDSWVRSKGATGWYNETYGGGWYMQGYTHIENYGSKRVKISGISDYYAIWLSSGGYCCEGYAGTSWNQGYGALNVGIENNAQQTPLLVAYRKGGTVSNGGHTGASRLFAMELLNSGTQLVFGFGGGGRYSMTNGGVFWAGGGVWSDGYISARGQNTSSDERLKNLLKPITLNVRDIAAAPSVLFTWKKDGVKDVGSIAQYWERLLPQLAPTDFNGYKTLQYGKAALLASISNAREILSLERRVERLEAENKELRKKIERIAG